MAQAFCHVCYGTSLTFENGVLVCDTCGTQTQTFQEEAEFQAGVDDTRGKRKAAGSSAAGQQSQAALLAREEERAAQQLQVAAFAYVRCLQQLLKAQAEALTTRFGVSSQVASILRQLWLTHLPSTGMLEATPARQAAAAVADGDSGQDSGADGGGGGSDDGLDPSEQQQQRSTDLVVPKTMKNLFWRLLHPQTTLQLCFIACCLLREAVTVYDIIGWGLDGQLPYLDLPHIAANCLSEAEGTALPIRCLQPEVSLSPLAFLNRSCRLAQQLGVTLPHVAGEALLLRAVQELGLPQVVLDLSLQLYAMYLAATQRMRVTQVTRVSHTTPSVWLSAVLVVSVKLLYGLGNAAGTLPLVPKAPGPPQGWQAWAQGVVQRLPGLTNMPLSEQEALALGPAARQQYLQYCRQYVFAGHPCVPTCEEVQRILLGWQDASAAQAQAAAQRASASAPAQAAAQQQQQQQKQQATRLRDPTATGLGPQQVPAASAEKDFANYSIIGGRAVTGGKTGRLEPELAAVVLVLAAYSRCSPAALVDCVMTLEKQLVVVESGVSIIQRLQQQQPQQPPHEAS